MSGPPRVTGTLKGTWTRAVPWTARHCCGGDEPRLVHHILPGSSVLEPRGRQVQGTLAETLHHAAGNEFTEWMTVRRWLKLAPEVDSRTVWTDLCVAEPPGGCRELRSTSCGQECRVAQQPSHWASVGAVGTAAPAAVDLGLELVGNTSTTSLSLCSRRQQNLVLYTLAKYFLQMLFVSVSHVLSFSRLFKRECVFQLNYNPSKKISPL